MRIWGFIIILLLIVGAVFYGKNNEAKIIKKQNTKQVIPPTPVIVSTVKKSESIFVPYWIDFSESIDLDGYDRVFYFGITATPTGIDSSEEGYESIDSFVNASVGKKKILTVRMTDSDEAVEVLQKESVWDDIISGALRQSKSNGFSGIALDMELGVIPFNDMVQDVNRFVQKFSQEAHSQNLEFITLIYGDTFYRNRPYDVATLAKYSDEIMVMAYDFHKSRGEAGPNFPLKGKEKYGYDYEQLLSDLSVVPPEKLSFIFGMYGYDWVVDEKKRPIKPAKALSNRDIKKQFIDSCQWKNCLKTVDALSGETEVDYVDDDLRYHIVWFEDKSSVERKMKFLQERGIGSFVYWTYGYF